MSLSAPQPLDTSHRLEEFDCGKLALTDCLLRYAHQAQSSGSARTFVVCDEDQVAGCFSLTVGQIDTDGWKNVRTNGSHHHFKHPTKLGLVTVPHPKKDLPIGTVNSILKQAGLK